MKEELTEKLAELEHIQWSNWTEYFLNNFVDKDTGVINLDLAVRWKRQCATKYSELTEKEKDSDRIWADKVIKLIKEYKG